MATIIGGIGTSHVPTIGVAYDKGKQDDPAWAPLFEGYAPVAKWLAEQRPDVLVFFYNDHATSFFFDLLSDVRARASSAEFAIADEGAGRRAARHPGPSGARRIHMAESLVNDEFDLALPGPAARPRLHLAAVDDVAARARLAGRRRSARVNVLQYPLPTALRCYKLGQAVRRAIESLSRGPAVVVVGTGGLSHQIHGERTGFNNTDWDMRFLDLIERDPRSSRRCATPTTSARRHRGRRGDHVARDARRAVERRRKSAPELLPADDHGDDRRAVRGAGGARGARHGARDGAARMNPQLEGLDKVAGTYPFDLATSVRTLRINRFFWRMTDPRTAPASSPTRPRSARAPGLSAEERG